MYGSFEDDQSRRGLRYANIKANIRSARELYTSDVTTAKIVLRIKNTKVIHTERSVVSEDESFHSMCLQERMTR